jgi:hypothetical protein
LQQIVQQSEVSRSSNLHSWRTLWGSTQFGSIPKELKEDLIWSQHQQVRHAKVNGSEVKEGNVIERKGGFLEEGVKDSRVQGIRV